MNDFECPYCKKSYTNKKAYDKHYLKCHSLNNIDNDFEVIPSINNIYKLVKCLIKENNSLKVRVNKLENKLRNKTNNKVNIVDWLNKKGCFIFDSEYEDYLSYLKSFKQKIKCFWKDTNYTINKLLSYNMVKLLFLIIKDIVSHHNILISFEKSKKIYYYNEEKGWEHLDVDLFCKLFQQIQKQMICDFMNYQKDNKISMEKFNDMSNKIYGGTNKEKTIDILYNKTCKYIQKNIDSELNIKVIY